MQNNEIEKFPEIYQKQFEALGTKITLQIVVKDENDLKLAKEQCGEIEKLYQKFTKIFSRFDSESELSKLNQNLGKFCKASGEMLALAKLVLELHEKTLGFFDPRIIEQLEKVGYSQDFAKGILANGNSLDDVYKNELIHDLLIEKDQICFKTRMDFSGIAKGFITDKAWEILKSKRNNFLIDSGGDIFFDGVDENGEKWTVDVEGIAADKIMFALSDQAIATSGIGKRKWEIDGNRYHHLINPKKQADFSFELKSVTVIAPTTTQADVWAKTLFLMGQKDAMIHVKENGLKAVILDYRGGAWISPEAKNFLK